MHQTVPRKLSSPKCCFLLCNLLNLYLKTVIKESLRDCLVAMKSKWVLIQIFNGDYDSFRPYIELMHVLHQI